jgi:hypothetical protein
MLIRQHANRSHDVRSSEAEFEWNCFPTQIRGKDKNREPGVQSRVKAEKRQEKVRSTQDKRESESEEGCVGRHIHFMFRK